MAAAVAPGARGRRKEEGQGGPGPRPRWGGGGGSGLEGAGAGPGPHAHVHTPSSGPPLSPRKAKGAAGCRPSDATAPGGPVATTLRKWLQPPQCPFPSGVTRGGRSPLLTPPWKSCDAYHIRAGPARIELHRRAGFATPRAPSGRCSGRTGGCGRLRVGACPSGNST